MLFRTRPLHPPSRPALVGGWEPYLPPRRPEAPVTGAELEKRQLHSAPWIGLPTNLRRALRNFRQRMTHTACIELHSPPFRQTAPAPPAVPQRIQNLLRADSGVRYRRRA